MWPCAAWRLRMANRVSSRSARVSPMPISRPVVYGTCSAPAAAMVAILASGSCDRASQALCPTNVDGLFDTLTR